MEFGQQIAMNAGEVPLRQLGFPVLSCQGVAPNLHQKIVLKNEAEKFQMSCAVNRECKCVYIYKHYEGIIFFTLAVDTTHKQSNR